MKKVMLSLLGVATLLVCAFFWLNNYIYNQKQPDETPTERVTLQGDYVCLPSTEAETSAADCAVGIKTTSGAYYALDLGLMSQGVPQMVEGDQFSATGVITPIGNISTDYWKKYPISGIFSVTDSLELVDPSAQQSTDPRVMGVYRGTLPCPGCEHTQRVLTINAVDPATKEGTYQLATENAGNPLAVSEGTWTLHIVEGKKEYELHDTIGGQTLRYDVLSSTTLQAVSEEGLIYASGTPYPLTLDTTEKVHSPLINNSWVWKSTTLSDSEEIKPNDASFVLQFSADESYNTSTDCNTFSGTFLVDHEVLSLSPASGTLMFCEDSKETEYIRELSLVNSFVIENGELRLNLNRDYGTMFFAPKTE